MSNTTTSVNGTDACVPAPFYTPEYRSMDDLYVGYVKPASCEEVFVARGTKWQFCWCRYGNGRIDIGVYSFAGDVCWGYEAWKSGVCGQ